MLLLLQLPLQLLNTNLTTFCLLNQQSRKVLLDDSIGLFKLFDLLLDITINLVDVIEIDIAVDGCLHGFNAVESFDGVFLHVVEGVFCL